MSISACTGRLTVRSVIKRISLKEGGGNKWHAGLNWRKLAPVPILALVTEYCELPEQQVVVLFQILAAEINFGYKFQTVKYACSSSSVTVDLHAPKTPQLQFCHLLYVVN